MIIISLRLVKNKFKGGDLMKKLIIAIMVIFVLAAVLAGCADDRNQPGQVSPMVSPIVSPEVDLSPVEITPLLPPADVSPDAGISPAAPVSPMPEVSPS
jgi:hypothetical protein